MKPLNKSFISVIRKEKRLNSGGVETELDVYRIKRNKLSFACRVSYNTTSYRGRDHETIAALVKCGQLPRSVYKDQEIVQRFVNGERTYVRGTKDEIASVGYCGHWRRRELGIKLYEL